MCIEEIPALKSLTVNLFSLVALVDVNLSFQNSKGSNICHF